MTKLEIACFDPASAYYAASCGADRIEICDDWYAGGVTPQKTIVEKLLNDITIEITVMIRPRGGDFLYNPEEFLIMKNSIKKMGKLPIQGFVFGVLHANGSLDLSRCQELIEVANGIPCVLHRAFDKTPDFEIALEQSINCGFKTILTSGHAKNVQEGAQNLKKLVELAKNRIDIMPGGGLRSDQISYLRNLTKAPYFHSSAITDQSGIADPKEITALLTNLKSKTS